MKERRKQQRNHPATMFQIVDRESEDVIGSLGNITLEGIMVLTGEPLNVNSVYRLRIIYPGMLHGREHLDLEAESLWCIQQQDGSGYQAGLKLTNQDSDIQHALQLLMESHLFHISQRTGIPELE